MASPKTGTRGLFLVAPAPNLIGEVLRRGYVAVFVSDLGLRAAATGVPAVQVRAAGGSAQARDSGETSTTSFTAAGQRFTVVVPREPVQGAAAVLPWVILVGGLLVVALGAALALNAARRARAQEELDRIFTLSQDLIAVADFDGRFTRVNPAAEEILGYTEEELLARPYIDLVHPADRDTTAAEADAIARGKPTVSFENRFVRKDGSVRVLDWTTTPDVEHGLMYAVARDVTERRNAEAKAKRLADEQAALRRVATLVARDASQAELFTVIAEECAQLFGSEDIGMVRYEDDRNQHVVASSGAFRHVFPVGSRQPLGGENAASRVFDTERPVRIDDDAMASGAIGEAAHSIGVHSVVATPIVVEGRPWGAMITAARNDDVLVPETESRLGQFTELMATAIANAEARAKVERLATDQAALRRVATMVAQGRSGEEVFAKVAEEVALLLGLEVAAVRRFEADGWGTIVGRWGDAGDAYQVGARMKQEDESVTTVVYRTGRSARFDDYERAGSIPADALKLGVRAAVASPIVVDGRLWGAIATGTSRAEPMPADAESRIADFTELVAAAISNVQARSDLAASRARIVATADQERRRVVRDLHDGAQQRLVHTVVTLTLAQQALQASDENAASLVGEALEQAKQGNTELRELAHGILPSALTHRGLRAGIDAVLKRLDLPVQLDVPPERFSPEIEATAYFIVAEALTNVVKHAHAEHAEVRAFVEDGTLRVEIRDDGIGGADPDGHGLVGIRDRVTALGGRLGIDSPPGDGTRLAATLPLPAS